MNKILLAGVVALFIGLVVIAAVLRPSAIWWIFWVALIVAWIWLMWIVRKKKTQIFPEQMDIKEAERRLKWLKIFLFAGGISLVMFITGAILHNVLATLFNKEEEVSFFIAIVGGLVLLISNIGSIFILLTGLRKPT